MWEWIEQGWYWLAVLAFCAGLIDAAVGGGGLIQIPALFSAFPQTNAATLFGTNKFASMVGTSSAVWSYLRRVRLPWGVIAPAMLAAFVCSFAGAATVALIPRQVLQPIVLVLLIIMAVYTLWKKDFGRLHLPTAVGTRERVLAIVAGGVIGFYDGLFGPGTGSFLIFLFIRLFAFDFIHASASAKLVNLSTNIAALAFFVPNGHVLWQIALVMALCNMAGALVGTQLALRQGTGFIRVLFLLLLVLLIGRMAWGMFTPPI